MKNKSRELAFIAVLAVVVLVQLISGGNNKGFAENQPLVEKSTTASEDVLVKKAVKSEGTTSDKLTTKINVIYRSTLSDEPPVGYIRKTSVASDFDNKILSYTNSRLLVYTEPRLDAEVAGVLYSKNVAEVLDTEFEWSHIKSGELEGYVRNTEVLFGREAQVVAEMIGNKSATVTAQSCSVYASPNSSSECIATFNQGDTPDVYDTNGDFLMVGAGEGYGFVERKDIEVDYGLENGITLAEETARLEQERIAAEAAAAAAAAAEAKRREAEAAAAAAKASKNYAAGTVQRAPFNATDEELHILAAIVFYEAGWQSFEGKLAVANVVLNRVLSPKFRQNTIASVVYAPGQFTGASLNGGPSPRFLNEYLSKSNEELNKVGTGGSLDAARAALSGLNNVADYDFFISVPKANYAKYIRWMQISNHIFYTY